MENKNINVENDDFKLESLNEINKAYKINLLLSNFKITEEFLKQSLLYIAIKKSKNEIISAEDIALVTERQVFFNETIDKIINLNI